VVVVNYTTLGKTDITISTIAMGCWALAGDTFWGRHDPTESADAVRAALDAGVTFFDTAEAYGDGQSEVALGKELQGLRHSVVIGTKASPDNLGCEQVIRACEDSLRRLQTDYIDLYQIHWPHRQVPLTETMEAFELLKKQGKIRAIGLSNFGVQDLREALSLGQCETNQLPYSLVWRAIEYEIQPECVANDVGIMCYSPLGQGLLTGKFASPDDVPEGRARSRLFAGSRPMARHGERGCEAELFAALDQVRGISKANGVSMALLSMAWLTEQPGVSVLVVGARSRAQMLENLGVLEIELAPRVMRMLSEATEDLKEAVGRNPDMWQSDSRYR
jgi:aryl-alcohol dehydrogenase-like predicted oxidoreductase